MGAGNLLTLCAVVLLRSRLQTPFPMSLLRFIYYVESFSTYFDWFLLMINWRTKAKMTSLIFFLYYIKQVDSMLLCVCSVIDHRGRHNVARTSVTRSAIASVPHFCSYNIFMSSVINYWTDARQHGTYLLINFHKDKMAAEEANSQSSKLKKKT